MCDVHVSSLLCLFSLLLLLLFLLLADNSSIYAAAPRQPWWCEYLVALPIVGLPDPGQRERRDYTSLRARDPPLWLQKIYDLLIQNQIGGGRLHETR